MEVEQQVPSQNDSTGFMEIPRLNSDQLLIINAHLSKALDETISENLTLRSRIAEKEKEVSDLMDTIFHLEMGLNADSSDSECEFEETFEMARRRSHTSYKHRKELNKEIGIKERCVDSQIDR